MPKQVDWTSLCKQYLPKLVGLPIPKNIELPVFPRVVTEIMRKMEDPNADIREIARIIETDSNLTCDLLKHVNSSATGRRMKASSAQQALMTLGLKRCKLLLLTIAAQSAVRGVKSGLICLNDLWAANIERGLFAREVALKAGFDADIAYTGAILQDLMLPAMTHLFQNEYKTFLAERNTRSLDFVQFEQVRFQFDHATLGALCLEKWGFPPELVCTVLMHHLSEETLQERDLMQTPLYAVTASALINDPLNQEPMGILRLLSREQNEIPFDLLITAERVDQEWQDTPGIAGNRVALMDRMETHIAKFLQSSMNDSILIDRKVGQYTLEEKIGEGAMGIVYKARHNMLQRPAAIKLIKQEKLSTENARRFEQEVHATCKLEHPNTISIYDYGHTPDGTFYYAMEMLNGITLKDLVDTYGPVPEPRVLHILYQMSGALSEAHAIKIIHRDIKPENAMLTTRGRTSDLVKVLDFGLAKHLNPNEISIQQGITGTPLYIAPESISAPDTIDHRSDIYSLGAVAYYLITSHTVFTGNSLIDICVQQLSSQPIPPSIRSKKPISRELEELILQCLRKDPAERPQCLDEVMQRLLDFKNYSSWNNALASTWWQQHRNTTVAEDDQETVLPVDRFSQTVTEWTPEPIALATGSPRVAK